MLIGIGNFNMNSLIDGMILMAKDQNSDHELNQRKGRGTWLHNDGWGIAYIKDGELIVEKSTDSIYEDHKLDQFRELETNLVIIHARKRTQGNVTEVDTQPFKRENFVFFHNGNIKDEILFDQKYQPFGDTDSEKLFSSIFTELEGTQQIPLAIRNSFKKFQNCKGTNIILSSPERTFVAIKNHLLPKYYGMKITKKDGLLIISSEILSNMEHLQWDNLEQNDIVEINNKTGEFLIHRDSLFRE